MKDNRWTKSCNQGEGRDQKDDQTEDGEEDMTEKEGTTWIGKTTLTTMEDIDGGLHPAVDGQSVDEMFGN